MDESAATAHRGRQCFGVFEFDAIALELRKNGRVVALRPQALKLLALLVAAPGEVVLRRDIERTLWGDDTHVDFEQGVNHAIRELRAALGDVAESPRFIQTLPRRGYRFLAPVAWRPANAAPVTTVGPVPAMADQAVAVTAPSGSPRLSGRTIAAFAVAALLVAALTSAFLALRPDETPVSLAGSAIAVRPFATSGTDAAAGVGLANAISARLGGQQGLPVLPSIAAGPSAGRQPRVTHLLSGEIVQSDDEVVVRATLEDVRAGVTLWSEPIRVRRDEVFSVENVIAERVAATLRLRMAAADHERLRRRYTSNGAAYEEYLRGRSALVKQTPEGTRRAIQSFESALSLDASYALARAGLAMACADMCLRFAAASEVEEWGKRAEAEARAALAIDADLAEAHLARAAVARKREFDWNATMQASRRALVLNPNLDQAHLLMAAAYYHLGYMDEALIAAEGARNLHSADLVELVRIDALVALFSGKFAPARARLDEVSRLSSQAIGDTYLALAHYYTGSIEQARAMLSALATSTSASTSARSSVALAAVLAAQGETAAARQQVGVVLGRAYRDHHVAYGLGAAYAQLGEVDRASHWLRIAADTGFPCLPWFERDPLLEPLRGKNGYPELLAYVRARRDSSLSSDNR